MKNSFILLILLLTFVRVKGQEKNSKDTIGIGILTVNTIYPIPLFINETDSLPYDTLSFQIDSIGVTKFKTKLDLKPYEISEGDSYRRGENNISWGLVRFPPILKFQVLDSTDSTFKIVTNEKNNVSFVIKRNTNSIYYETYNHFIPDKKTSWYIFETWERYLKRVEFIDKKDLIIYDQPNGAIIFENKEENFLPFKVIDINGDWIKLKKDKYREFNFDKTQNYDGWTQWKKGNKILIRISEFTYD